MGGGEKKKKKNFKDGHRLYPRCHGIDMTLIADTVPHYEKQLLIASGIKKNQVIVAAQHEK